MDNLSFELQPKKPTTGTKTNEETATSHKSVNDSKTPKKPPAPKPAKPTKKKK